MIVAERALLDVQVDSAGGQAIETAKPAIAVLPKLIDGGGGDYLASLSTRILAPGMIDPLVCVARQAGKGAGRIAVEHAARIDHVADNGLCGAPIEPLHDLDEYTMLGPSVALEKPKDAYALGGDDLIAILAGGIGLPHAAPALFAPGIECVVIDLNGAREVRELALVRINLLAEIAIPRVRRLGAVQSGALGRAPLIQGARLGGHERIFDEAIEEDLALSQ